MAAPTVPAGRTFDGHVGDAVFVVVQAVLALVGKTTARKTPNATFLLANMILFMSLIHHRARPASPLYRQFVALAVGMIYHLLFYLTDIGAPPWAEVAAAIFIVLQLVAEHSVVAFATADSPQLDAAAPVAIGADPELCASIAAPLRAAFTRVSDIAIAVPIVALPARGFLYTMSIYKAAAMVVVWALVSYTEGLWYLSKKPYITLPRDVPRATALLVMRPRYWIIMIAHAAYIGWGMRHRRAKSLDPGV